MLAGTIAFKRWIMGDSVLIEVNQYVQIPAKLRNTWHTGNSTFISRLKFLFMWCPDLSTVTHSAWDSRIQATSHALMQRTTNLALEAWWRY